MRKKNSLLIPAVLAFSLCTVPVMPVLAEDAAQTADGTDAAADAADTEDTQTTNTQDTTGSDQTGNTQIAGGGAQSADAQNTSSNGQTADTQNTSDSGQTADTSDTADQDTPYEKGTITDTDYQSTWLNLKFTPPETVVMNTEEELQSVMQQGQSTLEESSGVELNEDALSGTVYEMMASSISGFPNVSVVVEDAALENMTVDQYFLAAQQMLDATQMGYTYSEITDTQIAGQDFRVMETSVTVNDYEVLQKYCTRKQGGKFVSIILSYTTDTTAEADEILAAFTPLNTDTEAAPAE